jgi:hypothetical protein
MDGRILSEGGRVLYTPVTKESGFYLLGHDRWKPIDVAGAALVLGTFAAVVLHGCIRTFMGRSRRRRR